MQNKIHDWKDVASSYSEKAFSLAILLVLFAFLVSPEIEVKTYEATVTVTEAIDIPPEVRERIEPPEETVRPVVEIVIEDDLEADADEDLEFVETIDVTTLDPYEQPPDFEAGTTPRFVPYEDPPQPIYNPRPRYTDFARRSGIEGRVVLNVEVFADGTVGAVEVVQSLMPGPGGLDEAAVRAIRQWEFEPAKSGGKPVSVWVTFPVEFRLN